MPPDSTFFSNAGVGDTYAGGDTQVIHIGEDTVWSGCHCWGSVGEYELFSYNAEQDGVQTYDEYKAWVSDFRFENPFGQQAVAGGFGVDLETEELVPVSFQVVGQAGAYAIAEDSNGRVWFGGQYLGDTANGYDVEGIVRFSPIGDEPEVPGPTGLRTTLQTRERVVLNWQAMAGAESYEILRDGEVVGTSTSLWHVDRNLAAGTSYQYQVRAVLPDGTTTEPSVAIAAETLP